VENTAVIARGDVVVVTIAGKTNDKDAVFAESSWTAVVDNQVTTPQQTAFAAAAESRDLVIAALARKSDRASVGRAQRGFQFDDIARNHMQAAGFASAIQHGVGRSLDTEYQGRGANLDNTIAKDERTLLPGTGFVIGPGVYIDRFVNDVAPFGVRTGTTLYLGSDGAEVTGTVQQSIDLLLK
jgi:Xaa-Pro aminopeptidase